MTPLSQYDFDRLMITLENSRINWQAAPNKRVLQLAFEYIDDCRRVGRMLNGRRVSYNNAYHWLLEYPRSAKARRMVLAVLSQGGIKGEELAALTRVANMNEEHA